MSHELICSCLDLAPDRWPPDHYTLLGLEPGELDAQRIEQCAQERMERLRRYQLTHDEQVTEGMNRLAQALVCLTDPIAKQAYDAKLTARQVRRPRQAAESYRSGLASEEQFHTGRARTSDRSRWLLLAWAIWLVVGLAGLSGIIVYYQDIRASYNGEAQKSDSPMRPASKSSRPSLPKGP